MKRFPLGLRDSLRVRLLAGTLVWIVASIAFAGWGLSSLFRQHVDKQFHAELRTHLDQLTAGLALDSGGLPSLATPLSDPRFSKPYSGLYWQLDGIGAATVRGASGLLRSRSLWDSVIDVPDDALVDGEIHRHRVPGPQGTMLGLIERTVFPDSRPEQQLRLMVAADERLMVEPIERFRGALWLALALLGLGLVTAAVMQVAVGLAPLARLKGQLAAVRDGRAQALTGGVPTEIEPLVEEFNAVLAQNAEIVERARTHAGNLAHALKTPLSVLANAAASATDADRGLARVVLEQVDTARRQVDYHLSRARTAAAVRVPGVRTAVRPVADALARVMRRIHADRALELLVRPVANDLLFRGEEQDLQEMIGNLLDNACKWASLRVEMCAAKDGGELVVTIDDDGEGLAAERRNEIIRRGVRADEQTAGSGLGLAIVDELARLYGGRVELATSPLGGLRARLTLPAA